jgi:hypothetical protein
MTLKEFNKGRFGFFGVGAFEAVTGPVDRKELRLDAAGLEAVAHPDGLLVGDVFVFRAVDK